MSDGKKLHSTIYLLCLLVSARAQTRPMEQFEATGPYLNHSMPEALLAPAWSAVPAFPHLLFTNSVGLAPVPGTSNLLCVWEREGRVWTFANSAETTSKKLLLDLSSQCQGWDDSGLLGLAFHPGFPTNHFLFVYYAWVRPGTVEGSPTQRPPASTPTRLRLSRFSLDPGHVASRGCELVFIDQKAPSIWHMGGALVFHPKDGCLYLGIGDNNERTNTQCLEHDLFSGILRIDVDQRGSDFSHPIPRQPEHGTTANYFIPNNNPFVGRSNVLEEFFALGLRNPYRMSCDPDTGRLFITDVGEQLREEINLVEPTEPLGLNFQWPMIEGLQGNLTPPYFGINKRPWLDYTHAEGQAVIGGFVYRGQAFRAELGGKYIFGDNVQGKVWYADPSTALPAKRLLCVVTNGPGPSPGPNYVGLSSFGQDQNDELYICQMSSFGGLIFKLARNPEAKPTQPLPSVISKTGAFSDLKAGRLTQAFIPYDVNSPLWSDGAVKQRWMALPRDSKIGFSPKEAWRFPNGSVFVKTFSLPIDEADPSKVKRLETRFLVRDTDGAAYGVTYKWRPDNSDADLQTNSLIEIVTLAQRPVGLLSGVDIGNPARKGSVSELLVNGEERVYEVKSFDDGGNDLTDELVFAWQERRGDFDIQVRIDPFAAAGLDGKAGLAVRESLAPGSRQVSALVLPDNNLRPDNHGGYQLEYRAAPGGRTRALFPPDLQPTVAYPQAWLRLKRRGNEFSGFASQDGITWRSFGSVSLPLPESIKFGVVLSAHSPRAGAAARFHFPALRQQQWYYPSTDDCLSCHTRAAQFVLGVKTRQLNRDFVYPDAPLAENQLRLWNQLKLFEPPLQENEVTQLDRLAPLTDTSAPLELRVRSYCIFDPLACRQRNRNVKRLDGEEEPVEGHFWVTFWAAEPVNLLDFAGQSERFPCMTPRLKRISIGVAIGSGLVVVTTWILVHTIGEREAMFQGKPLDVWVSQLNQPSAVSNEARLVLDQIAIPQLIESMFSDTNDSKLRLVLIEQLNNLPGVTLYFTPADGRRANAAQSLGEIGPGARAAIPSLIKALKGSDRAIRGPAALALGKIQSQPETVIPLLIASIDDPQDDVQSAAVEGLGEFGPLAKEAIPKIAPLLKAPDKDMRKAATGAMKKIQPLSAVHN